MDGHPGCLHVLANVNSAAINTEVHVAFGVMVFSGYMSRGGICWVIRASLVAQTVKNLPAMREIWVGSLG